MVKITKEVGYPEGGKKYKGAPKNFGLDPRAKVLDSALIDKGTKVKVQGTGAMLKSKNKTATWF